MRSHLLKGYGLALLGVLLLSPDALLIRLSGDDVWQSNAWRGLVGGLMVLAYNHWLDKRSLWEQTKPAGIWFFVNTLLNTLSPFAFVYAIHHANVTDVLVVVAFSPLLSALFSAVFLGETVHLRTWLAVMVCGVGLAILFTQPNSQSSLSGLLAAFFCAVMLAAQFVIIRAKSEANLTPALALGYMISGFISLFFASAILPSTLMQWPIFLLMSTLVVPLPFVLFFLSLRYISAAETSLIMLLESILGSLWVWRVLNEQPSSQTLLAGILILSTLSLHTLLALRMTDDQGSITQKTTRS